jgi:DNA-binding response OmpR family regulator
MNGNESNGVILLAEDDIDLNNANRRALELRRYTVYTALTLAEARDWLNKTAPDIILLDVMLPDGDGFSFCQEIREKTQAHILFLTSRTEHEDLVRGLTAGGDDYIIKPFHAEELLARVEAAMRRRRMDKIPVKSLLAGNLSLDTVSGQAYADGNDLLLTPKEFALLRLFLENEGSNMSNEVLYENVWKAPILNDVRALRRHISELRSKLNDSGCSHTVNVVYGKGYCFEKKL